jgi:hypothetical protein
LTAVSKNPEEVASLASMANSNVVALSKIITLRNRSGWVLGSLASFANGAKGAPTPPGAEVVQQLNIQEQLYQALALNPPCH